MINEPAVNLAEGPAQDTEWVRHGSEAGRLLAEGMKALMVALQCSPTVVKGILSVAIAVLILGVPYLARGHLVDDGNMCFNLSALKPPTWEETFPLSGPRGIGGCPPGFEEVEVKKGWFGSEERCALSEEFRNADDSSKAVMLGMARLAGLGIQHYTNLPVYNFVDSMARSVEGVDSAVLSKVVEGFRVLSADLLQYKKEVMASNLAGKNAMAYWEKQAIAYQAENKRELSKLAVETKKSQREWKQQMDAYFKKISEQVQKVGGENKEHIQLILDGISKSLDPLDMVRDQLKEAIKKLEDQAKLQKELIELERQLTKSDVVIKQLEAEYDVAQNALEECKRMYKALSAERLTLQQECEDRIKAERDISEERFDERQRARRQKKKEEDEEFLRRAREAARAKTVGILSAFSSTAAWILDWILGFGIAVLQAVKTGYEWLNAVWDGPISWMLKPIVVFNDTYLGIPLLICVFWTCTTALAFAFRFMDNVVSTWGRMARMTWWVCTLPIRLSMYYLYPWMMNYWGHIREVGRAAAIAGQEESGDQSQQDPSGNASGGRQGPTVTYQSTTPAVRQTNETDPPTSSTVPSGQQGGREALPKGASPKKPRAPTRRVQGIDQRIGEGSDQADQSVSSIPEVDPTVKSPDGSPERSQMLGTEQIGQETTEIQVHPVSTPSIPIIRTPSSSNSPPGNPRGERSPEVSSRGAPPPRPSAPVVIERPRRWRRQGPRQQARRPRPGSRGPRPNLWNTSPTEAQWHPNDYERDLEARTRSSEIQQRLSHLRPNQSEETNQIDNSRAPGPPSLADWVEAVEREQEEKRLYHVKGELDKAPGRRNILIDTGATSSILPRSLCVKHGLEVLTSDVPIRLFSYSNQAEEALGTVALPVTIGEDTRTVDFLVSPSAREVILGLRDLKTFEFTIDTARDCLVSPNGRTIFCHSVRAGAYKAPKN